VIQHCFVTLRGALAREDIASAKCSLLDKVFVPTLGLKPTKFLLVPRSSPLPSPLPKGEGVKRPNTEFPAVVYQCPVVTYYSDRAAD
jgi:hypothetical protein